MLSNIPRTRCTVPRLVLIPLILLICSLYYVQPNYDIHPVPLKTPGSHSTNLTEAIQTFNSSIIGFWKDFVPALQAAKPKCKPIRVFVEADQDSDDHYKPLDWEKKRPRRLGNITLSETALFRAHYVARRSAQYYARKMPLMMDRTGIVTTADSKDMPAFLVSLRMLRWTGCNLPVEVFVEDWTQHDFHICNIVLPSLHARCVVLSDMYNPNITTTRHSNIAHNKIISILFSTFQHTLYLDIGAFPTYDPTILFSVPPYTTHGLITWPDFTSLPVSEHFYHIAGLPVEPLSLRPSTAAGHMMLNKALHRESLLMMLYYTYHGPSYFFPLICQTTSPWCFKEIFTHAAQALRLPWYQVRTRPRTLGRRLNGTYHTVASASADPGLDYESLPPFPSHMHPEPHWTKHDVAHPDAAIEARINMTRHAPPPARPVFVHQRTLPLDPATVLRNKSAPVYETDGTPFRMWGLKDGVVRVLGYDVERRVWNVVADEACRVDAGADMCRVVGEWVREVVGWMDSIDKPWW